MPCLFAIFALATPRLVVACLWIFTSWFRGVVDIGLWLVLGFLFLPTTLLWYSAVHHWFNGQWTLWPVVGIVVALLIDLSPSRARRRVRVVDPMEVHPRD